MSLPSSASTRRGRDWRVWRRSATASPIFFSHGPNTQLQISELRQQLGQTLAIHNVYETFIPREKPGAPAPLIPPVLATNIYLLTPHGWRMTLHHASLSPRGTTAEEQGVSRILH